MTSGVTWCDMDMCDWLNKFYAFRLRHTSLAIDIVDGRGLNNETRR